MLKQIEVNPATEKYIFTQVVGVPVFVGAEITPAAVSLLRMNRVKDQMGAALNIASDAGFYFSNNTADTLALMRASLTAILNIDQAVKAAVLAATEVFTIETVLASSKDGATQQITITLYSGLTKLLSETRVKATNSFVAAGSTLRQLNGKVPV